MLYGLPYSQSSPEATICPCCGAEWLCTQEHQHICQQDGCEKPISLCCISSGHAKPCEYCGEWHCAEHLTKTDCGMLCGECEQDLCARSGDYFDRIDAEQTRAIGAEFRARVGAA